MAWRWSCGTIFTGRLGVVVSGSIKGLVFHRPVILAPAARDSAPQINRGSPSLRVLPDGVGIYPVPTMGPSAEGSDRALVMMLAKASLGLRSVLNIGVPQQALFTKSKHAQSVEPLIKVETVGRGLEQLDRLWRRVGVVQVHLGRAAIDTVTLGMAAACGCHAAQSPFDSPTGAGKGQITRRGGHYAVDFWAGTEVLPALAGAAGAWGAAALAVRWFSSMNFSTSGRIFSRQLLPAKIP